MHHCNHLYSTSTSYSSGEVTYKLDILCSSFDRSHKKFCTTTTIHLPIQLLTMLHLYFYLCIGTHIDNLAASGVIFKINSLAELNPNFLYGISSQVRPLYSSENIKDNSYNIEKNTDLI